MTNGGLMNVSCGFTVRTRASLLALSLGLCASAASAHHPQPPVTPVVKNSSFDADASGVASPQGWVTSGAANADFTEWGGHNSDWRLTHWASDAYSVDTEQTITGLRPGWYTLRGYARRGSGQNNSYLELQCGCDSRRVDVPVAWWDQWLQLTVSMPVTSRSCKIVLHTDV